MNPRSIDKKQAQELIKETFENPFDKVRFTNFIKNLLNRIDDAPFICQGNYIPDAYKQYIKILERIGKFSDGENRWRLFHQEECEGKRQHPIL
jgi:spermidine/putrescine-binding protein